MEHIILYEDRLLEPLAAHIYLMERFGFDDGYGRNLDALYDELTSLCDDVCVSFIPSGNAETAYIKRVKAVFADAAEANGCLHLIPLEDGGGFADEKGNY